MKTAGLKRCMEFSRSIPSFVEAIDSPEDGVQIWIAYLDSILPNDMVELGASLDSAENVRAAQFHFERDRKSFVGAHGILRCLLGVALDIPASEIAFEYGAHGKPTMVGHDPTVHFNISHAAGTAIFALAWDHEVGIDLEATARLIDKGEKLSDLATRILSPRELAIWRGLPNDAVRTSAFLRAWTRKEAYIKATGEGLSHGLKNIEVALDAAAPQQSLTIRNWIVHDLSAPAGFVAALGVETTWPSVA